MDVQTLINVLKDLPPGAWIQAGEGFEVHAAYYDESLEKAVLVIE